MDFKNRRALARSLRLTASSYSCHSRRALGLVWWFKSRSLVFFLLVEGVWEKGKENWWESGGKVFMQREDKEEE